ncbi:MAG: endonuclease/exonuclease/phosphatase family protein [Panacagrimonas sp.]
MSEDRAVESELQAALPQSIKVLTLNTHKGFTTFNRRFVLHELREAIRSVGADIVFLQEVLGDDSAARPKGVAWSPVPQYEFLADSLWPHFSYGRNAVYPQGHHGNAVLSKFPIVSYRNVDVSISGPERRGVLHCVLRQPGWKTDVHAICVHLGLMESHRAQQLHRLCTLIEALPADAPVILSGDFNDWRQRASGILSRAGLEEVFARLQSRPAKTFPAAWPLLRLDRIYCRNVSSSAPRVLSKPPWSQLSDHAALFAEIRL